MANGKAKAKAKAERTGDALHLLQGAVLNVDSTLHETQGLARALAIMAAGSDEGGGSHVWAIGVAILRHVESIRDTLAEAAAEARKTES